MIRNKKTIRCKECGQPAIVLVIAVGFDDDPKEFTMQQKCNGPCKDTITPLTAKEMHDITGLPLTGWSNTSDSTL